MLHTQSLFFSYNFQEVAFEHHSCHKDKFVAGNPHKSYKSLTSILPPCFFYEDVFSTYNVPSSLLLKTNFLGSLHLASFIVESLACFENVEKVVVVDSEDVVIGHDGVPITAPVGVGLKRIFKAFCVTRSGLILLSLMPFHKM